MGRKTYNSLDDLFDDLDKDSFLPDDDDDGLLDDADLALLHGPTLPAGPKKPRTKRKTKSKK